MVWLAVYLFVSKFRVAFLGGIKVFEKTVSNTVEFDKVSLYMCINNYIVYASFAKCLDTAFYFCFILVVHHIVLVLCCSISTFHPISATPFFGRHGNVLLLHNGVQPATRTSLYAICTVYNHCSLLLFVF